MVKKGRALSLFSVVLAWHTVYSCCFPEIFEGQTEFTVASVVGKPAFSTGQLYLARDAQRQMDYIRGRISENNHTINMEFLADHRNQIQYSVVNGACSISKTPLPMIMCMPANATRESSSYYGYDGTKVEFDVFKTVNAIGEYRVSLMKGNCAPLRVQFSSSVVAEYMFSGLMTGVSNQTIFNPPPSCKTAKMNVEQESHLIKLHQQMFNI